MSFTKRLGGIGGTIFRSKGLLPGGTITLASAGLTNTPANSGLGYEGQTFQTYLITNNGYTLGSYGFTINITIPLNYVLGGFGPSALHALDLTGFTAQDTINIYNYGSIIGGQGTGGAGGNGNASGFAGSSATNGIQAIACLARINLYNYGQIRGGGSGGGGGGGGNTTSGKGYANTVGGSGGPGAGLNIPSAAGANQTYAIQSTPVGSIAGGASAGSGGSGGVYEGLGSAGTSGTYTITGKVTSTVSTSPGAAGSPVAYAIYGASKVTVVANTGTIGTTAG